MTKLEQAARQALEALNAELEAGTCEEFENATEKCYEAITALREALAEQDKPLYRKVLREMLDAHEQAEQEPVAYAPIVTFFDAQYYSVSKQKKQEYCNPLYAAPVRTKDLTDDEIMKINVDTASIVPTCDRQFHFARAVIKKFKEKNNANNNT